MKIFLASDHAGFEFKKKITAYLQDKGFEVIDKGPYERIESDDYPDFVSLVAREISKNGEHKGIIIGGSGQGEAMVANRFRGVRAAVYYGGDVNIVKVSREHNDSNILSIGIRFTNEKDLMRAVRLWLQTPFSNEERHARRIKKIDLYPNA